MELPSVVVNILNAVYSPSTVVTIEFLLIMTLVIAFAVLCFAIRVCRKSAKPAEFSTSFYVKKERYGVCVMEDQPYDYIKQ